MNVYDWHDILYLRMTVRCHCAFWDKDENNAGWVKSLSASGMKAAINEHIDDIVPRLKGKLVYLLFLYFYDILSKSYLSIQLKSPFGSRG